MSLLRPLLAATASASLLLLASSASADVLTPGTKIISYSFAVHGLPKADRAVFAYPCSTSSGVPVAEMRQLEDGKALDVGRRGGSCEVYSIDKATYDDFAKTYVASHDPNPALDAFVAKATKCAGAPTPVHELADSDPRSSITEDLDFTADATSCKLTSRSVPVADPVADKTGDEAALSPATPTSDGSGGGCSASGGARAAAPWLVALAVPLLLGATRRRKA